LQLQVKSPFKGLLVYILPLVIILGYFYSHWDDFVVLYMMSLFGTFFYSESKFGVFFELLGEYYG